MPNSATMSIYGLLTYDNTIFDNMVLPASIDASELIDNIVLECSEIEILYPDASFMKTAIAIWSKAELPTWEKIAELAAAEYNPIENYDRYENEATGRDRTKTLADSQKTTSISHSQQNNEESSNTISNSAHNVTGYNTNNPVTESADNDTSAGGRSETMIGNSGGNTETSRDGSEGEQENMVRSIHTHGNIGVKSSQQLQEESLQVLPKLNVINYITESFKRRFCVLVY